MAIKRESKIKKILAEFDLAMNETTENLTESKNALMEIVRSKNTPENVEGIAQDFLYYLNEVFMGSQYIIQSQKTAEKNKHSCELAAKLIGAEIKDPENA